MTALYERLEEVAGLESHHIKPFVLRRVDYIPEDEIYRISLTWFEAEAYQNNYNISEELETPC